MASSPRAASTRKAGSRGAHRAPAVVPAEPGAVDDLMHLVDPNGSRVHVDGPFGEVLLARGYVRV